MPITRSPKKTVSLPTVRCTEDLLHALEKLARLDGRVFADYVRRVLERHVYDHELTVRPEWAPSKFRSE